MRRVFLKNRATEDIITFEKTEHSGIAVSCSKPSATDYDTQEVCSLASYRVSACDHSESRPSLQWEVEVVGDGYRIRNPKSENYILSWMSPPVTDVPVQALRSFRTDETLVVELPDSLWTIRKVAGEESYLLLVPGTTLAITQTDDPVVNVSLVQTCGLDGIDVWCG